MKTLDEFARLTGLELGKKFVQGQYRGYPTRLDQGILDNWRLTVTFVGPEDHRRASRIDIKRTVRDAGLGGKGRVEHDHIFIEMAGLLGLAKARQIKRVLDGVIGVLAITPAASQPMPAAPPATGPVAEFAALMGLQQEGGVAFGQYRGYLVKLTAGPAGTSIEVMYPKAEDHVRVEKLRMEPMLATAGLAGTATVAPGRITIEAGEGRDPADAEHVKRALDNVLTFLEQITPPFTNTCMQCGKTGVERTVLAAGVPTMLCSACLQGKTAAYPARTGVPLRTRATYDRSSPDYAMAVTFGLLAMFGMAVIWGIISAATDMTIYYLAFALGFVVAYATAYGAGRPTGGVLTLGVILAFFSSLLGEILFIVFVLMSEGVSLGYVGELFGWYVAESPEHFWMTLVLGLIGAGVASWYAYTKLGTQRRRYATA